MPTRVPSANPTFKPDAAFGLVEVAAAADEVVVPALLDVVDVLLVLGLVVVPVVVAGLVAVGEEAVPVVVPSVAVADAVADPLPVISAHSAC